MPDYAAMREINNDRQQRLAMQGIVLNPAVLMAAQIEVLVKKLAPNEWEVERSEILDLAEEQANRAKLTAGFGQAQLSLADIGKQD